MPDLQRFLPGWLRTAGSLLQRQLSVDRLIKRSVLGVVVLAIIALTLIPVGFLIWTSVWSGYPGQLSGSLTLEHFVSVYLEGRHDVIGLFSNSLFIATGKTLLAMSFGLLFAWLFVRTDLPTKGLMELVLISPYAIPGYLYAFMYIVTYGPKNGIVSNVLSQTLGIGALPFDLYSPWGIIAVTGLDSITSFYLLTLPALKAMNPAYEEVTRIHGANIFQTIRSVTFPLILPAILSASLVTFVLGLGEFSVVEILGARAGFDVFATAIYDSIRQSVPPNYGAATALSFSLLLVTLVLVAYYRKVTQRKESYMTVTGGGYQPRTWNLGRWRWPVAIVLWIVLFVVWILPILVMIVVSLHSTWVGEIDLARFSLEHYLTALGDGPIRSAFTNSVLVSLGGATIGTVLVVGAAYYTERTRGRLRGVVDFLSLTPMAVPGIIMGASVLFAFLWLGNVPFLDLYGTLWIIIIGSVIVYIPVSSRIAVGNIVQIHSELEEAAHVYGASWLQNLREIFLPLFSNTVGIIWFYLLIHIFQLLTIAIMTFTSSTRVVPVEIFFAYYREAQFGLVSAVSTIFIALTITVLLLIRVLGVRFYETRTQ